MLSRDLALARDAGAIGFFSGLPELGNDGSCPSTLALGAYVSNDPVNLVDPLGEREICWNVDASYWASATERVVDTRRVCSDLSDNGFSAGWTTDEPGNAGSNADPAPSSLVGKPYNGPTFCSIPTYGRINRFNPSGRIVSGRTGDRFTARSDLNTLAALNGIPTLRESFDRDNRLDFALLSPIPILIDNGWFVHTNPYSRDTVVENRGLSYRNNQFSGDISIDIPSNFVLPSGAISVLPETCHYYGSR